VPDELSQHPRFAENVRRLEQYGLTFDLCFLARQLPLAVSLARRCPGVQFILDHCGVPDITGGALDPWRKNIRTLADLPNVACKISGVLAYCSPGEATAESVRPYVDHCLDYFGWDRVVWGGDWPVCNMTSDLKTWVDASRELVAGADPRDQQKLFSKNAERIYGLAGEVPTSADA
jgi:predicted TIM-barrel fold metal-dependent hydrolase